MAITDELGPAGGGAPFVGLNDDGALSNEAPLFFTDPYDTFFMGTRQLPGECSLQAVQIARIEVNKKKGKGLDGARITLAGYDPKEFQVVVQVTTAEQDAEMQDILDVYWRIPGKTTNLSQVALTVAHPRLTKLKIHTAVLIGVSEVDGKLAPSEQYTFTFQEAPYIQKKKNVTKSAGPPARDAKKLAAANKIANGETPPPSSQASNMSTSGPLQSTIPAGAQ